MAQQSTPNFFDPKSNPFLDPKNNPFLDPKNNPFLDASKNPFMSADMAKMFGGYQAPQMQDVMDSQRKNFEALAAANKTAVEGLQAVFARQAEILKETMDEVNAAVGSLNLDSQPDQAAGQQIDQLKDSLEQTVSNMRELSEMVAKSQNEAFEILNKRLSETLDEFKGTVAELQKAQASATGQTASKGQKASTSK